MRIKNILLSILLLFTLSEAFSQNEKVKAYITISEECPICVAMVDDLKLLIESFHSKVDFVLVFPMMISDSISANNFILDYDFKNVTTMVDGANNFCKENLLKTTPETLILSSKNEIIYRGRISNLYSSPGKRNHRADKYEMKDAILFALNLNKKEVKWQKAVGCAITYEI